MFYKNYTLVSWLFGIVSGFTLTISGSTLNYWLSAEQIDVVDIGVFALISLPYAISFLWAPIFDSQTLGILTQIFGHRLSWIILLELLLSIFVLLLSLVSPTQHLLLFATIGLIISFLSSANDTVLGALRTEVIPRNMQGYNSGFYIFGYRIGMMISGYGAIYLSYSIDWQSIYTIFGGIIVLFAFILAIILYKWRFDPQVHYMNCYHTEVVQEYRVVPGCQSLYTKIINLISHINRILQPIGSCRYLCFITVFLILYRLPDNFINTMIHPFLLHLGYSAIEIANVGKLFGITSTIIGSFIASIVMRKLSIRDSLLIFGIIHAIAHTLFIVQAIYAKNLLLLTIAVGYESLTGGMTMTAYIAYIACLCRGKYRATQYSFLSSMMGFSRSILPTLSGYAAINFGWRTFFILVTVMTVPGLVLLRWMSNTIKTDHVV